MKTSSKYFGLAVGPLAR